MTLMKNIWHCAGNIYLTMGILIFMILDLLNGYLMLKYHAHLFEPINDMGFIKWAVTFGKESPGKTAWLFVLVVFLALLGVNTFVCTTDRVIKLWQNRHRFKRLSLFVLRFGPHVMHYSMLIMFLGYLVSYLFSGTYLGKVLLPGKIIQVSDIKITLEDLTIDYYTGTRLANMEKRAIDVKAKDRILIFRIFSTIGCHPFNLLNTFTQFLPQGHFFGMKVFHSLFIYPIYTGK